MKKLLAIILPACLLVSMSASAMHDDVVVTKKSETTSQYMSDAAITTKVKSDLLTAKHIKSLDISVTTVKGVVTLTGNVNNAMQKKEALRLASHVKGVKSVVDDLTLVANQ